MSKVLNRIERIVMYIATMLPIIFMIYMGFFSNYNMNYSRYFSWIAVTTSFELLIISTFKKIECKIIVERKFTEDNLFYLFIFLFIPLYFPIVPIAIFGSNLVVPNVVTVIINCVSFITIMFKIKNK